MKDIRVKELSTKDRVKQVEEQFRIWEVTGDKEAEEKTREEIRFITISRDYGCAGFRIGDNLATVLNSRQQEGLPPWTVYDHKLVDLVCQDHNLSQVLVENLDKQRKHIFGDYIKGLFTGEPSTIQVFKRFAETIFQLASRGKVIIIGRASSLITGKLTGGLHIRIVSPLEWRIKQVAAYENIDDPKEARRYTIKNDRERGKFSKYFLGKSLKNPAIYDMILNQQRLGLDGIVNLILEAMQMREEMKRS